MTFCLAAFPSCALDYLLLLGGMEFTGAVRDFTILGLLTKKFDLVMPSFLLYVPLGGVSGTRTAVAFLAEDPKFSTVYLLISIFV